MRWIDYWDGRSSQVKIPIGTLGPYPTDFNDNVVNASPRIEQVSQALQNAFAAGDAAAAAQLFTADAVYEDMALHTRVEGQLHLLLHSSEAIPRSSLTTTGRLRGSLRSTTLISSQTRTIKR